MQARMRAGLIGLTAAILLALGATVCTTFNGLEAQPEGEAGVVGGSGGASNDAGAPGYLSAAEAATACSTIFRCPELARSIIYSTAIPVDEFNYSTCMNWLAGPIPPNRVGFQLQADALRCVARATTCAEAGACLWIEYIDPSDPRCADAGVPEGGDGTCADDGGTVLYCASSYAVHCGTAYFAPGSTCLHGTGNNTGCAQEQNCTVATTCVGSVLTYCGLDNLKYGLNCAYAGYACGFDTSGIPCIPPDPGPQCQIAGATSCAGDVLQVCDGLYESVFDCAAMGAACSETGGSTRCATPNEGCSSSDSNINVCAGTSISLCYGGKRSTFDCAAIGLSCVPGAQGKSSHCG